MPSPPSPRRPPRPAPSRDRTQRLLAETNLTYLPMAAQTGLTLDGIRNQVRVICVLSASLHGILAPCTG